MLARDITRGELSMIRMSRIFASGLLAAALGSAPALAAASDYFLKLEGVPGESKDDGHRQQIEILAFGWGETRDVDGNGAADALTDGLLVVRYAVPGVTRDPPHKDKLSALAIDHEVKSPRDAASGQASGKRMHKPRWVYEPEPLNAAGSLTVKASVPGCAPGQRYGGAQFAGGGKLYQLSDVVIAGCAPDAVSLNYRKVTVKGWNPEKKED
jgi:hypothetical protein